MSFLFDSDIKERVRAATDIVDLIGARYELRRQGRNYLALCPYHRDTRPSLQINTERQTWKCWVCNVGGDAFSFLMQDDGISFREAFEKLAERAGIRLAPIQQSKKSRHSRGIAATKEDLYRVLQWAQDQFRDSINKAEAKSALDYMLSRGLSQATLEEFAIGFAPGNWTFLLEAAHQKKISNELLEAAGLVAKRDSGGYYDRFRQRITFPIRDREGRVIAFGGRVLPGSQENAKYINSPETSLFHKSQQLYGFDRAHKAIRLSRQAIVMEGYTDVMFAHQCGLENCVAVLGTALGSAHLKFLRSYCDTVILLLDGDAAGQKRSDEVLELFMHAQMNVRVATLPDNLDPADFLQKFGPGPMRELVEQSSDALEFKLRRLTAGFDPLLDTHRAGVAVEEMLGLLAKASHSSLVSNDVLRMRQNQILPRLARSFSIPENSLRERLTNLRQKSERIRNAPRRNQDSENNPSAQRLLRPADLSPYERELLELIIVSPQVAPLALERVHTGWLETPAAGQMLDVYQELDFRGESLAFEHVLIALEDSSLKSLLVTLHEQAMAKLNYTRESPEGRLRVLTHRMGEQQDVRRREKQITEIQTCNSEEEELRLLHDVIRQARLRQGLLANSENPQDDAVDADDCFQGLPNSNGNTSGIE
ncbi:MAG: DNA primase [Planctomycetales bacterium]|nr:DNA primase [Planctomycetales bacterium]